MSLETENEIGTGDIAIGSVKVKALIDRLPGIDDKFFFIKDFATYTKMNIKVPEVTKLLKKEFEKTLNQTQEKK